MDDELIRQQVLQRLQASQKLDASEIYVSVQAEKVILDGTVASQEERREAEQLAGGEVENHLRIHQSDRPA